MGCLLLMSRPARSTQNHLTNRLHGQRCIGNTACSRGLQTDELRQKLLEFNEQFAEARMCLDDARESKDTSYFADDIEEAKENVDKCIEIYEELLGALDEEA